TRRPADDTAIITHFHPARVGAPARGTSESRALPPDARLSLRTRGSLSRLLPLPRSRSAAALQARRPGRARPSLARAVFSLGASMLARGPHRLAAEVATLSRW